MLPQRRGRVSINKWSPHLKKLQKEEQSKSEENDDERAEINEIQNRKLQNMFKKTQLFVKIELKNLQQD